MDQVRFGIIGAGGAFHFHSNGDRNSKYIKYVALYDINYENAKKTAKRYKDGVLTTYETLDEMLDSDIDAVLVMVPHAYHVNIVVRCAEKGKHVLCEKPMGTTVEGCRQMIEACRKNNVKFMIAENHRFLPAHNYIHDAVQSGMIGDVLMVRAYEGVNEIPGLSQSGFWKGDPIKAGGGALMDMASHKFAAIEYILQSRCEKVTAVLAKQAINLPEKAEDNAIAIANFENGAIADITVSFTQMTPANNSMEIYGTRGTILENHDWVHPVKIYSFNEKMGKNQQTWYEPEIEHGAYPEYYTISVRETDEHFAKCVIEDRQPAFTPEDAMSAIECILAGYLSAIEKRPVERKEIAAMADQGKTMQILEKLAAAVPINKNLPEVKIVEPVGYNKERASKIMIKHGLDLLIAASPVNVYYLSGLPLLHSAPNPILEALNNQYPNLAMIRRGGEGTVVNWNVFRSVGDLCWVSDSVGIESRKDVQVALRSKIRKWGLAEKCVGVESTAPKYLIDALKHEKINMKIIEADEAFRDMRIIKSDREVEYIGKATDITEKAILRCIDAIKVGVTDTDLLLIARKAMIDEGADDWNHLTMNIGDSDPEAPGIGRKIQEGEIIRLDFGAVYKGYVADVNKHVIIGSVPEKAKTLIDGLLEFQKYFADRIKPGVSMKDLGEAAFAWYNETHPAGLAFAVGHSIGLECEDLHMFGSMGSQDRVFEKNMVFEIEAWEKYEGSLIGVEDCYVVTDTGCKMMTTLDKTILSI